MEWISVKTKLPRVGEYVLALTTPSRFQHVVSRAGKDKDWITELSDETIIRLAKDRVTHWMPLPSPPSGGSQ